MKQKNIEIYLEDPSEEAERDFIRRNYRPDVYVKLEEEFIQINVYGLIRLIHDFESSYAHLGFYLIDPNLVLVKETDTGQIITAIVELHKRNLFLNFKPLPSDKIPKELHKVYPA